MRLKPVEFRRRSVWHAHTGYANLSGQLLNLSATLPPDVAALATVEPAGAAVNALVAHAGHTSNGGKTLAVTLVLRNCVAVSMARSTYSSMYSLITSLTSAVYPTSK